MEEMTTTKTLYEDGSSLRRYEDDMDMDDAGADMDDEEGGDSDVELG